MSDAVLDVRGLKVGYGDGRLIVDGVDLKVEAGEIVTMIGQNGAGKSTVLKGIYNMARERHGDVLLAGEPVFALPPHRLLQRGLAYIPQDHTVFPRLSIAENLAMGGYLIADRGLLAERIAGVEAMFPVLAERRQQYAASLSGGEQRMLEIARTLVMDPKVIMLDEPSIGLAPRLVDQVFAVVRRLAEAGKAILMVSVELEEVMSLSDRILVMCAGKVSGECEAERADEQRLGLLMAGVTEQAA